MDSVWLCAVEFTGIKASDTYSNLSCFTKLKDEQNVFKGAVVSKAYSCQSGVIDYELYEYHALFHQM